MGMQLVEGWVVEGPGVSNSLLIRYKRQEIFDFVTQIAEATCSTTSSTNAEATHVKGIKKKYNPNPRISFASNGHSLTSDTCWR
jgi:hypothetical protein